jgi:alpha-D-xyloside xylohydrolase
MAQPLMAPVSMTGGPNEVWSFGTRAYEHIAEILRLRERLRPYLHEQMRIAHDTGLPPMRPLFVDFPDDPNAWDIDDAFLLGPDLLVAPVLAPTACARQVWLPAGADWTDIATGRDIAGGQWLTADAPLGRIPLYARAGRALPIHW